MAYNFYAGKMLSQDVDSYVTNGIAKELVPNGALVKLGDLVKDATYAENGVEYDTYEIGEVEATTDEVAIVDYAGISEGEIAGNDYKLGIKLYDLQVPAGVATRVRRLALHDKFWLAAGNISGEPKVGQYAIPTAGAYTHAAAANLEGQSAGYAIKIIAEKDLTAGMRTEGKQYLCEVVQL